MPAKVICCFLTHMEYLIKYDKNLVKCFKIRHISETFGNIPKHPKTRFYYVGCILGGSWLQRWRTSAGKVYSNNAIIKSKTALIMGDDRIFLIIEHFFIIIAESEN